MQRNVKIRASLLFNEKVRMQPTSWKTHDVHRKFDTLFLFSKNNTSFAYLLPMAWVQWNVFHLYGMHSRICGNGSNTKCARKFVRIHVVRDSVLCCHDCIYILLHSNVHRQFIVQISRSFHEYCRCFVSSSLGIICTRSLHSISSRARTVLSNPLRFVQCTPRTTASNNEYSLERVFSTSEQMVECTYKKDNYPRTTYCAYRGSIRAIIK